MPGSRRDESLTEGKHCTKCGLFKPLDEFYPKRADCKKCKNKAVVSRRKQRWKEDPEAYFQYMEKNKLALRKLRAERPEQWRRYWRRYLSKPEVREKKNWQQRASRHGVTEEILREVWKRCNSQCQMCGAVEGLHVDHIRPSSQGYVVSSALDLQLLCRDCNSFKGNCMQLADGSLMLSARRIRQ